MRVDFNGEGTLMVRVLVSVPAVRPPANLCQSECDQARAQKRETERHQGEETARDFVLMSHGSPPARRCSPEFVKILGKACSQKVRLQATLKRNQYCFGGLPGDQPRERTPSNA
jgi:hypothetical protein